MTPIPNTIIGYTKVEGGRLVAEQGEPGIAEAIDIYYHDGRCFHRDTASWSRESEQQDAVWRHLIREFEKKYPPTPVAPESTGPTGSTLIWTGCTIETQEIPGVGTRAHILSPLGDFYASMTLRDVHIPTGPDGYTITITLKENVE